MNYKAYLNGDDEGLRRLINEYYDGLTLFLCTITRNMPDAEEMAEQTFVRLAVKKPEYKGISSFRTWLYAIGRNITLDSERKKRRHMIRISDDETELRDTETDIEEDYINYEKNRALYRSVQKLEPRMRQVTWLFYFENMSYEEIAGITGNTKGAVAQLLLRARNKLREMMEKEGYKE
ncbi:MAG: RNA polymerase sigma factor [Clostridia bacterium]|nr:RNA polymerase sigma factor [Clostridia bacterium]